MKCMLQRGRVDGFTIIFCSLIEGDDLEWCMAMQGVKPQAVQGLARRVGFLHDRCMRRIAIASLRNL